MEDYVRNVAAAFVHARRAGSGIASYPGRPPQDLDAAYRIQDAAIGLDGRQVVGWKVGRINSPDDVRYACNRLSGPIFAGTMVSAAPAETPPMPVFAAGFAAAEAELVLHDVGTRAIVDKVRLGIEIASSPYPGINDDGPAVTTSDFGNNYGLVVGPDLSNWRDLDLSAIRVRTSIGGTPVGEGTAATMLDGPFGAVRFLLANLVGRGIDCSQGLWVSTGAITGVHPVAPGQIVTATFGELGEVGCRITPAAGP
jgi:2-keto-4-pentenoate hydratase